MSKVKFDRKGTNVNYLAHIRISLIINSRGRPELFKASIDSLAATCSDHNIVEILLKLDADDIRIPEYIVVLENCPFAYKVMVSDRFLGYWSLHISHNELAKLSNGDILWIYCDDMILERGDWVSLLLSTRDIFPDNIYVVKMPGVAGKKEKIIDPAFSQEWFKVLNFVSPHVYADRFIFNMGKRVGRLISNSDIMNGIILRHNPSKVEKIQVKANHRTIKQNIDYHVEKLAVNFEQSIGG